MEFLVFDHDDHDILLGLDWFYKTGCGIYRSQGILDFKNSISIQNESIIENPEQNKIIDIFHSDVELSKDFYWDMSINQIVPASGLNTSEKIKFNSLAQEAKGLFKKNLNELEKCSVKTK
ncbi:unnamed protein product [Brachionus calyciflorus]|uniref:Uncharacterized protein n=1 Tax=Brachionus calyciflorus TaxID=104777 RepID=A0A814M0E4_9BILA|nr:unnamed protein product [Brachionus calyciflorus]